MLPPKVAFQCLSGSSVTDITLPESYLYIVLHWGGGNANDVAYYTGGDSSSSTFDFINTEFLNQNGGKPQGLSSVTAYACAHHHYSRRPGWRHDDGLAWFGPDGNRPPAPENEISDSLLDDHFAKGGI